MILPELAALSVARAEEEHVRVREIEAVAEPDVRVAEKALVHFVHMLSCVAFRVDERESGFGMIDEQAYQFAGCVAGSAYDADPYHIISSLWLP